MSAGDLQKARTGSREAAVLQKRRWLKMRQTAAGFPVGLIQPLPPGVWLATGALAIGALATHYPMLTVASILMVPVLASLLLIKGDSPILFVCCMMQWLQATTAIFYCDFKGVSTDTVFDYPNMELATRLSLVGILVLAVGMRVGLGRWSVAPAAMESEAREINQQRLIRLWWITFFFSSAIGRLAWGGGGLAQFFVSLTSVQWAVFYVLAYRVLTVRKGAKALVIIIVFQFVVGIVGFFGSFKEPLFMFLMVAMSLAKPLSFKTRGVSLLVVLVGIVGGIFWSAVKSEYRAFLTGIWERGRADISLSEKLRELDIITTRSSAEKGIMDAGFQALVERVSYTQLFGRTLEYVPAREPYQDGRLWWGAIDHVLKPRIFFPDKGILDDSSRAVKFTGLELAGADQSTSIGIGYMAESYVDFGNYGMNIPLFLFGVFMARIYRFFASRRQSRLWGVAIGTGILFSVLQAYATSNVKLVGGLAMLVLTFWALDYFFGKATRAWLADNTLARQR